MENIQRDLEKEIAALQASKPVRKNRHWTVMFVGDHGQVVTIRWFRWMLMVSAALLVLAVMAGAACYYLYRHARHANEGLQRSLDQLQQQIAGLRTDKEVLMAQLVVSRTDAEKHRSRVEPKPVEKVPGDRQEERGSNEFRPKSRAAQQSGPAASVFAEGAGSVSPGDASSPAGGLKILIEEFQVSYEAAGSRFKAQFVLKNTGPNSGMISGYTAVILKRLNTPPDKWLALPTLKLTDGVPSGDKPGQYFSIARFKTVWFSVKSKMDPQPFDAATVYVFDEKKNLLLEKHFSIRIHAAAAPLDR